MVSAPGSEPRSIGMTITQKSRKVKVLGERGHGYYGAKRGLYG